MKETIRDWKNAWVKNNGHTNKLEVVIRCNGQDEQSDCLYEGSFRRIPEKYLKEEVVSSARIIASSVPERVGAYTLSITSCKGL